MQLEELKLERKLATDEPNDFCKQKTISAKGSMMIYYEFFGKQSSNRQKSNYQALIHAEVPNSNTCLWELKVYLKIKIKIMYLRRRVVLTKDNLDKHNGRKHNLLLLY